MASNRAIPPLLQTYIELPPELSTVLLTSILGASANWLVERFMIAALSSISSSRHSANGASETPQGSAKSVGSEIGVVLVSWVRDFDTWKAEIRKASGIDLAKFSTQGRFLFVDGLAEGLQVKGTSDQEALRLPDKVNAAIKSIKDAQTERRVLLILDQPDAMLATASPSSPASATAASSLLASIATASQDVHATVVVVGADMPLVAPALNASNLQDQITPVAYPLLDSQHATLLMSLAHRAKHILQLRKLETGWASDVSGVLRISRGGGWEHEEDTEEAAEKELMYHVKGDGSVKVFERGSYATS